MDKPFPKIVVGCFILNDQNELLLVKSYKWPGLWVVMGGHIEWGETIAGTVERETMEEVGLQVKFTRVIEVAEFVFDPAFHNHKHFVGLQSECRLVGEPTVKLDNNEIQEAKWFPLIEAASLPNILPITQNTIRKIIGEQDLSNFSS